MADSEEVKEKPETPDEDGKEYSTKASVREEAAEIYRDVVAGFEAKKDREDDCRRYWKIYDCKLSDEQSYSGRSQIFMPIARDAVEARTLRFTNTLFPSSGRYVECISSTGDQASANRALINHYVRAVHLREIVASGMRAGDVTGQYSLYAGWSKHVRKIRERVVKPVTTDDGLEIPEPIEDPVHDVEEKEVTKGLPDIWVIPDEDLCVLPATADSINEAETVAVAIRVTKRWLKDRKDEFVKSAYKKALKLFEAGQSDDPQKKNAEKERAKEAGVKSEKGVKTLLLYEIWTKLELDGEDVPASFLCAGQDLFLTIKKNPYWGQRCPVISAPLKKIAGSFWGVSPMQPIEKLAYQCNDAVNMGMDSAQYALTPIVLTNPRDNPRIATMVLEMAALWEADPNSTKILEFPKLWQDALTIVAAVKAQIHESFGLNPALMPSGSTKKTTQAAAAQEQAIAIESVADVVTVLEEAILSPLAERIFEYDQQYRDEEMEVEHFGELGYEATFEKVPPVQFGSRYQFVWNGIKQQRSVQMVQQMIATMNVLRGIPPQQLNGRVLDVGPILDTIVDIVFGPRLGSKVLKDVRSQLSMNPEVENQMMAMLMPVEVSPLDNDAEHMQSHNEFASKNGDPAHHFAVHQLKHQQQMMKKAAAAAPPQCQPGVPRGGPPGVAGTPRMGAQPQAPGGMQNPPGSIHQDQVQDPGRMPRR